MGETEPGKSGSHTVITREELLGVEFDWFAADRRGHVAQFMAAGDTQVPEAALASEELLEALHVWIDTRPETEPPNAPAGGFDEHLTPPQRRGAYVYDRVPEQEGIYRLVAAPRHPFTVQDLPPHLRDYLRGLVLNVQFGEAKLRVGTDGVAKAGEA